MTSTVQPRAISHRPRGKVRPSRRGIVRAVVLVLVHVAVLLHVAHWKIAGSTLTPLEPSEAKETIELGLINAGFVLFVLLILATLVVGRFFCGWACHVVAYQDASAWLLGKLGLRPRAFRSRALMAVPFLAAFDMFVVPTLFRLWRGDAAPSLAAHFLTSDLWASFPGPTIALVTLVVDGSLVVWFLGSKGFCTNACPYGAFFGVAQRFAPGKIVVSDACEGCGHCTAVCTSNVQVHAEVARYGRVVDPGCMRCMDCVSSCPKEALSFGFGGARTSATASGPLTGARRTWDVAWGTDAALFVLFVVGVFSFRGLYSVVPFMLALGLGVLFAAGVVSLVAAVRSRDFAFQHTVVKSNGRWSRRGAIGAFAVLAFVVFGVHSAVVQGAKRAGTWNVMRAAGRDDVLARGAALLEWADARGLARDPEIESDLGMVASATGEYRVATERFRRAVELAPRRPDPWLGLAEASLKLRDLDSAEEALGALLALDPSHVRGRWRAAQLAILRRDFERAERLLDALLADAPDHGGARSDRERLRATLGR